MSTSPSSSTSSLAMQEFGPDSGGRMKGVTVVKPIVIGNVATPFGKKRESDGHTHTWTVYLKPYYNQDYSAFIKKVQFKLHDSYDEPTRIITEPPFEVTETGWGEFEIPIKIFFLDPNEKPVTVHHALKLFQSTDGTECQALHFTAKKKSVFAESYDEIVFHEPTRYMKSLLDNTDPMTKGIYKHETDFETNIQECKEKLDTAKTTVKSEIEQLRNKLLLSRETILKFQGLLDEAKKDIMQESPAKKKADPKKLTKGIESMKINANKN